MTFSLFVLGRTETVNVVSEYSKNWIKAMQDPTATDEERRTLLQQAISYQSTYRLDATVGNVCDRHLIGLLCAAREMEMDYPKIFTDKVRACANSSEIKWLFQMKAFKFLAHSSGNKY